MVVVGFYPNDVLDSVAPHQTVEDGYLVPPASVRKRPTTFRKKLMVLANESHLARMAINLLSARGDSAQGGLRRAVEVLLGRKGNREVLYSTKPDGKTEQGWVCVESNLCDIATQCKEAGARLLVVFIPERKQVYNDQWERLAGNAGRVGESLDRGLPNTRLRAICDRRGMPCLDLLPLFREKGVAAGAYFTVDPHLTPEGHRLAAEAIAAKLGENPRD